MTYLMPARRIFELAAAIYGTGYGVWIWMVIVLTGWGPLWWTGTENEVQMVLASLFMGAGLVHALGVWVNGSWRWSPVLRLTGLLCHMILMIWLASNTLNPLSTAVYNYLFIGFLLFVGAMSAVSDVRTAIIYGGRSWKLG